ncbi:hypothetical protein [Mucilaginibacter psychrotolerans]|uniref:Uncharacterized protein n=1 Tax=Mucilaginibacter psychrotolerans TaxID=1524096 RepID=A0A4Y8S717_9SPHI|nr:hypothetical protein [Mucilaginibacter psychrotolerans]TFF34395.1 hypothetical protein E2R66_22230 [Mucilaginibacter psychrotolerans]
MAAQNIRSASAAARANALSQLDSLGSSRSEFTTEAVFSALEKDAANFIERVHENINSAGIANTGGISDIRMVVSDTGIDIVGKPYLIYQDKGVSGVERTRPDTPFKYSDKKPPASAFIEMIKRKNLNLRKEEFYDHNSGSPHSDVDGDEAAIKSLSYAMRESIYKEGFPAKNLFSKEVPKLVADVTKSVSDFATDFIISSIRDGYGNNIGKVGLKK